VVSHEALSRMTHEPYHPPDRWLSRAEGVGQRTQLERGVRLAIDDTGAGYSSPRHVIELAPDSSNSTGRW